MQTCDCLELQEGKIPTNQREVSLLILSDGENSQKHTELIYLNLTTQVRSSVQAGNTNIDPTLAYEFTPLVLVSSKPSRPFPARPEGDIWILSWSSTYFTVLFISPKLWHTTPFPVGPVPTLAGVINTKQRTSPEYTWAFAEQDKFACHVST